jgi:hypothetical protein
MESLITTVGKSRLSLATLCVLEFFVGAVILFAQAPGEIKVQGFCVMTLGVLVVAFAVVVIPMWKARKPLQRNRPVAPSGKMSAIAFSITAKLFTRMIWQIALALVPFLLTGLALAVGWNGTVITIGLAVGWTETLVLGLGGFESYRSRRAQKTAELGRIMYASDWALRVLISSELRQTYGQMIAREKVNYLLNRMREVLAYDLDPMLKGATLLILEDDDSVNPRFTLFDQVNHDHPGRKAEIETHIFLEGSLAGQAIRSEDCVVLHDCKHHSSATQWVILTGSEFRGRAAVPVPVIVNGRQKYVGALCFDAKQPWTLSEGDRDLMKMFADKIGALWSLCFEG